MVKTSVPSRVLSVALAAALCCTMMPAQGIAYAAGTDDAITQNATEDPAVEPRSADPASAEAAADGSSAVSDSADQASAEPVSEDSAAARVSEDLPVAQNAAAADGAASANADIEITRTSVTLGAQAAMVFSHNGLVFRVNADDPDTVACIGWTDRAPEGDLQIPEQAIAAGKAYPVTRIMAGGGSELGSENPADPENAATADAVASAGAAEDASARGPYATECFADADKAAGVISVHIPATVESIDPAFFQLFPNAASVEVDPANSAFTSLNGMLFSADLTILHLVPEGMEGVAVLPESLATVPAYVISRCKKLFGLTFLPSGSTGNSTFTAQDGVLYTSDKTTLVAAPAGLGASIAIAPECTAIAAGAFLGNEKLKTIIAMGKVAEIAAGSADAEPGNGGASGAAFEVATIEGATVITDDRAAWEAAGFTHFASPAEPGEVLAPAPGDSGFTYTLMENGQLSVKWTGDAPASGKRNIPSAATLHGVDYTVSVIEDGAFEGQDELTEIVLPDTITTIGERAFAGCAALESAQLAGSVTSIGASAFEGCASLGALDLGSGLRTIGERAFAGTALAELVLPAGVQSIGASVFADCEQLVAIVAQSTIPDVSETALADVSGVNIYAPYEQDGQYAWNIGPVASANHLLAYGVSLPAIDLQLQAGQEGNLLDDGGYLEAPGDMTAQLSYNAKSISVDANGAVSAIQPGISTVTARLMLGELLLANATRTVRVSHAAALPAEGADAEGDVAEEAGTEDEDAESDDGAAESEDGPDADLTDPATQPADSAVTDTEDADAATAVQPPVYNADVPLDTSTADRPEADAAPIVERPATTGGTYIVDEEAVTEAKQPASSEATADDELASEDEPAEDPEPFVGTTAAAANPAEVYPQDVPAEDTKPSAVALLSDVKTLLSGYLVFDMDTLDAATSFEQVDVESDDMQEGNSRATAVSNAIQLAAMDLGSATYAETRDADNPLTTYITANGGTWVPYWCDASYYAAVDPATSERIAHPFAARADGVGYDFFIHKVNAGSVGVANPGTKTAAGYVNTGRVYKSGDSPSPTVLRGSDAYKNTSTGAWNFKIIMSRTGYHFTKWTLNNASSSAAAYTGTAANTNGKRLYAHWEANTYTITLSKTSACNTNTGSSTAIATYDAVYPSITVPTVKPGYSFQGYYTGQNGTGDKIYNANGTFNTSLTNKYTTPADKTLYAYTPPISYTMTVDPRGGKFSDGTTAAKTTNFTVETNGLSFGTVTRSGWTFAGWEITGDLVEGGGIENYTAGDPTSIEKLTGKGHLGNVTVRAIWRATLTIKRSAPDLSPSSSNTTSLYRYYYSGANLGSFFATVSKSGSDISNITNTQKPSTTSGTKWVTAPTAAGYTLNGFYLSGHSSSSYLRLDSDGKAVSTIGTSIDGDTTWEANWKAIQYTITLDPNGGTMTYTTTINYTVGQTVPFYSTTSATATIDAVSAFQPKPPSSSTHMRFIGWRCVAYDSTITHFRATEGKPYAEFCLDARQYGNYTLKAVWERAITFDPNAPTAPKKTTVNMRGAASAIYFYSDYGFSWSSSPVFPSNGSTSSSFPTKIFDSGSHQAPTIDDDGWSLCCIRNTKTSNHNSGVQIFDSSGAYGTVASVERYLADTLYLHWEAKTYTITLNPNPSGSTDAVQSGTTTIKYKYGANWQNNNTMVGLPDCLSPDADGNCPVVPTPTKAGWTFAGYYYGDLQVYESSGMKCICGNYEPRHLVSIVVDTFWFPNETLKGNITLTAKWQRTIPINPMGGTLGKEKSVTVNYGGSLPETLSSDYIPIAPEDKGALPEDTEWRFSGFYDEPSAFKLLYEQDKNSSPLRLKRVFSSTITTTKNPTDLEALWYRIVSIDLNGGQSGWNQLGLYRPWSVTALGDEQVKSYTREGYAFAGLATTAAGDVLTHRANGTSTNNVTSITCPTKLYCQWEPEEATIAFDANGGTGGPADIVGETDQEITDRTLPSAVPTRPDYTFSYWSTDPDGANRIDQLPEKFPAGTTTYYAQYEEKPASIIRVGVWGDNYSSGGTFGFGPEGDYYDYTVLWQYVKPDTGEVDHPIYIKPNEGYEFEAWYEFDFYGNKTFKSDDIAWRPERPEGGWPGESVFLIKFKQKTYSIKYGCAVCRQELGTCKHVHVLQHAVDGVYQGGLPTSFQYTNIVDEQHAIRLGTPGMTTWYEFAGWSGTDVPEGTPTSFQISTLGNKIYYIHPKAKEYTLTLDANTNTSGGAPSGGWSPLPEGYEEADGTGDHPSIKRAYTVETNAFQLPQPVWAGHTFDHWENANGQSVSETFTPGLGNYGNQTLHAVWSKNPYQITYQLGDDDGSNAGWLPEGTDNPHNYDFGMDDITLPIPSRVGYDFIGWTETIEEEDPPSGLAGQSPAPAVKGDSPQIDVTIPTGSWGNRIYKAHWRAHEYNIAYDLDGGAWEDPQPDNPQVATHDQDVVLAKAPKRAGYLFQGWQFVRTEGDVQAIERYEAGQSLTRPNFTAQVGEPAYEGVSANKGATATIEAMWLPNLSVDVVVGSQGVHMGLQLKTDPDEPFETTRGEAVLKNRSDAPLKVVEVAPNSTSDYEALKESALELFLTEESLEQAAFMVRPSKGSAANTQSGWFGIADPAGSLVLRDDIGLNSPTPNCPRNWYMGTANESTNELKLYYQLDMGDLRPEDVDVSEDKSLHVADLRYTVALVLP